MAESSDRVSRIAAKRFSITNDQIRAAAKNDRAVQTLRDDIRSLAGSVMRQDETRGLRGLWRKVTGR